MTCPHCGAANDADARFCRGCGKGVEPAAGEEAAAPAPAPASASASASGGSLPLPSRNDPADLVPARALGWNWGGFLVPYFWLMGHGRVTAGFLLQISMGVPLLNLLHVLLYPLVGIYLGLNGYQTAWRHQPYHSLEQLRDREREWTVWGFTVVVLALLGFLVLFLVFGPLYRDAISALNQIP